MRSDCYKDAVDKDAERVRQAVEAYYAVYNNGNPVWPETADDSGDRARHPRTENPVNTARKVRPHGETTHPCILVSLAARRWVCRALMLLLFCACFGMAGGLFVVPCQRMEAVIQTRYMAHTH